VLDHSILQSQVYVATVAEEGSFLKAAKRLHTAQTFLTKKVAEVERDLKVKIFERSTRRLELTAVGRVIVPEIQLAMRQAEQAWDLARYYSRLMNGPIRVGYSPYTNDALLRTLYQLDISEFEAQRIASADSPEPRLIFENSGTPELIERVLRGRLHASLGVRPIRDRQLWVEPMAREPFCVCLARGHAFAKRPSVTARDLHGWPILLIPRDMQPEFYDQTTEYIRSTGAQPAYHEVHAIEIVAHGFGIALLPFSASRLSHAGVVFKPIADRYLQIETALFARRDLMQGALKDFAHFLAARLRDVKPIAQ
jgi:LysR family transcriptional regulator, benzoate and cis,cis-muconate-responsive activator of ben and cat genes